MPSQVSNNMVLKSIHIDATIAAIKAVMSCEYMDNDQIRTMVARLANAPSLVSNNGFCHWLRTICGDKIDP